MLKADNIRVKFNGLEVLKGITFEVDKGQIALVVGPNGSGKSTLFKAVMGAVKYSGNVTLDGMSLDDMPPYWRFRLGIVLAPEKMRVAEDLTVKENIEISGNFEDAVKIFPELEQIGRRKARVLSGGERQMVVFSRAILSEPSYLLLDEPFQGLSDENAERIISAIEKQKKTSGITLISHDRIEDVLEISDKLLLMLSGKVRKIIEIDSPDNAIKKLEKYMIL